MRHLLASIFTLLLTLLRIALTLDPQTKVEIDELITFVETLDLGSRRGFLVSSRAA